MRHYTYTAYIAPQGFINGKDCFMSSERFGSKTKGGFLMDLKGNGYTVRECAITEVFWEVLNMDFDSMKEKRLAYRLAEKHFRKYGRISEQMVRNLLAEHHRYERLNAELLREIETEIHEAFATK